MRCAILFRIIKSQQFSLHNKQMYITNKCASPWVRKELTRSKFIQELARLSHNKGVRSIWCVGATLTIPTQIASSIKKVFFYFSVVASQYSSSFMASTYWAMPSATSLAAFMASTTVWGRCTTSPPANTPRRVVIPMGRSPQIT